MSDRQVTCEAVPVARRGAFGCAAKALRFLLLGLALTVFQTPSVPAGIATFLSVQQ